MSRENAEEDREKMEGEGVMSDLTGDSRSCIRDRQDTTTNNITLIFAPLRFAESARKVR